MNNYNFLFKMNQKQVQAKEQSSKEQPANLAALNLNDVELVKEDKASGICTWLVCGTRFDVEKRY